MKCGSVFVQWTVLSLWCMKCGSVFVQWTVLSLWSMKTLFRKLQYGQMLEVSFKIIVNYRLQVTGYFKKT